MENKRHLGEKLDVSDCRQSWYWSKAPYQLFYFYKIVVSIAKIL